MVCMDVYSDDSLCRKVYSRVNLWPIFVIFVIIAINTPFPIIGLLVYPLPSPPIIKIIKFTTGHYYICRYTIGSTFTKQESLPGALSFLLRNCYIFAHFHHYVCEVYCLNLSRCICEKGWDVRMYCLPPCTYEYKKVPKYLIEDIIYNLWFP